MTRMLVTMLIVTACLFPAGAALSQDKSADATVHLSQGSVATALRNQNGVTIHLTSMTRGLNVKIAAEGVHITLTH